MSSAHPDDCIAITASVTSVFYRRPSPGEPPFVEEGAQVEADTVVCLLEIMKCFRSVAAGVRGSVAKVVAQNGEMVNKGDVLMLIRPGG